MTLRISSSFDGGNIEVEACTSPDDIRLSIRRDKDSDFFQWFFFRLTGAKDTPCRLLVTNAGEAAYAGGWQGYRACASYDRETWFRVDTAYDGTNLAINLTPASGSVYLAYFAPYSMERHADLIVRCAASPICTTHVLGPTLDGQDLDMLEIGHGAEGRRKCWFIARQHPGETMAEWWMEGFLDRLLDPADPVARGLLEKAQFYVVPNMNPDGSRRGHLRTNAAGVNLNREWNAPSMEKSPEVAMVRDYMRQTGVDFHFDVHGDEELPYNFIIGFESIPSVTERQLDLLHRFTSGLARLSPDFQTEHGYPVPAPGSSDLRKCSDWVAETFGCPAMTLEMPFKDNADAPDPEFGWSPARCKHLGRSCLDALALVVDELQ